jgi:hypothetical protein
MLVTTLIGVTIIWNTVSHYVQLMAEFNSEHIIT